MDSPSSGRVLRSYEVEVLRLMLTNFSEEQLTALAEYQGRHVYEYTGWGYYLTLEAESFPQERSVVMRPHVCGTVDEYSVGFVIFLEDHKLILECFPYVEGIPVDFRDRAVEISLPHVHEDDG